MTKQIAKKTDAAVALYEETRRMTKQIAKKTDAAVALYEGAAGDTGFEGTTAEDYAIPFVKLLQKGSPECDKDDGAHVEGAEQGKFYNTATGEVTDHVDVIPCHYRHAMVEWKDRDEGGGFVGQHEPGAEAGLDRDERGRFVTDRGTYMADTRYFFCVMAETMEPVVVSFTSTQLKKARNWMTRMQAIKATGKDGARFQMPMYSHVYRLTSVPEQNDQGSWRGYKIEALGTVEDAGVAQAARDAREMFRTAAANVKPPADGGDRAAKDANIPF